MNTDRFFKLSERNAALYETLDSVSKADWKGNPCTKWLLNTLANELEQMFVVWYNGLGEGEKTPFDFGVAQGQARAVDDIIDKIQEMLKDDEHTSSGPQDTY
jgi:hypothetical protein